MKGITILKALLLLVLGYVSLYGKEFTNTLKQVYYLKEPVPRLIFEFEFKPVYNLVAEDKKLVIKFKETHLKNTSWLRDLPKDLFQEFNLSLERDELIFEIRSHKKFNFQAQEFNNSLIFDLLWEEPQKVLSAQIIGNQTMKDKGVGPQYSFPSQPSLKEMQVPFSQAYQGTPISVDFQEADLHAVFRLLAEVGGFNLTLSDKVKGKITLRVKQVPWDQVLDLVLASQGLAMVKLGNVVRIVTLEEIKAENERYKDYLNTIKDLQEKGPSLTQTFQLKYVKGDQLISKLKEIITGEGKITFEPTSNMLIIKDTEKNLKEIERIIKEIDRPTRQVLIEARIVEIQDSYAHRLGVRWGGTAYKGTEHTIFGVGRNPSFTTEPSSVGGPVNPNITLSFTNEALVDLGTAGSTNLGFAFGHIGKSVILLDVELSALESEGVARIFARPKILTLDNQDAEIKQGYKIPYLQLTQYGVATTQFIEAVLRLKVTPHVTPDNRISLDVEVEKSTPDWGRVVNNVPALLTRFAKTRVLINSGETLVIGGIKTDDLGDSLEGVPGLSKVPGLGELFKKKEKTADKTELMVFITPRVVSVEIPGVDY